MIIYGMHATLRDPKHVIERLNQMHFEYVFLSKCSPAFGNLLYC